MLPDRRAMALATAMMSLGALMASISNSVVNVAFPVMATAFHVPEATIAWVSIAYTLVSASLLTIFGRLSDMAGRKRYYALGVFIFMLGSVLSATSGSVVVLIGWRILQGLGSALISANSLAYLVELYPANRRGFVVGAWEACIGAGQAVGPMVGGFLLGAYGWPAIFYVNIPFGLMILGMIPRFMIEPPRTRREQEFDLGGALLFGTGVGTLLYALTQAYDLGWASPIVLGCLAAAAISLTLFAFTEAHVRQPMVDLSMFRNWTFAAGNLAKVFAYLPFSAHTFLLPFYMERVLNLTPTTLGLSLTPLPVGMLVASIVFGPLSDRIGTRRLAPAGLFLMGLGSLLLTRAEPRHGLGLVLVAMVLAGMGIGAFIAPNDSSILSATARDKLGVANGIMGVSRQLGLILGLSVGAGMLSARIAVNGGAFLPSFHQVYAVVAAIAFAGIGFAAVRDKRDAIRAVASAPAVAQEV